MNLPVCRWRRVSLSRISCGWCGAEPGVFAAWRAGRASGIHVPETGNETPMSTARDLKLPALMLAGALSFAAPQAFAADDETALRGAAVTVFKAAKSCFGNNVEVSGTIIPREETQVRPERMGLKVA